MNLLKLPSSKTLWAKHEQLVLEIFTLSLQELRNEKKLPVDEDSISEVLALKTRKINFSLNPKGRGLQYPPDWEKPKPPLKDSDLGLSKKKRRPDFTCTFRNNDAQSHEKAWLDFHVECKRLGKPSTPTWILNRNYVTKGIIRFIDPDYGYGERVESGAMIGYIQNMNMSAILEEINENIKKVAKSGLSPLKFSANNFDAQGIAGSSQKLKRTNLSPASFGLHHLWVDLRRE